MDLKEIRAMKLMGNKRKGGMEEEKINEVKKTWERL